MESKFESSIREIPYSQEAVYRRLSDLALSEEVRNQRPEDKREDIIFENDTITMNVPPVGKISIAICEREEPKTIKYKTVTSPLPFNLWVQLLPTSDTSCKMRHEELEGLLQETQQRARCFVAYDKSPLILSHMLFCT